MITMQRPMTKLLSITGTSPVTWNSGTLSSVRGGSVGAVAVLRQDAQQDDQPGGIGIGRRSSPRGASTARPWLARSSRR